MRHGWHLFMFGVLMICALAPRHPACRYDDRPWLIRGVPTNSTQHYDVLRNLLDTNVVENL